MSHRPIHRASVCLFVVALLCASSAAHAIVYVNPAGGNHIHMSICPAVDGANVLDPDPATPINGVSLEMFNELTGGDTPYPGWTYQSAANDLNGTFNIDIYKSKFQGTHHSGAEISIRYVRAAGDPAAANMRWVQLINTNSPLDPPGALGPPTSPYLDPYPDDADGEGGPFYYSDELGSKWDYRKRILAMDAGVKFYDFSSRSHPPTSYVEWQGDLVLTELTPVKNVVFYNGVRWGFKAGCINWNNIFSLTFGIAPATSLVTYDPGPQTLSFAPVTISVLNPNGAQTGVAPMFIGDPMLNAQMIITPFRFVPSANLQPGLFLFEGGSIQVVSPMWGLLYSARIPYLVLGDDMHPNYNMAGVYGGIQPSTSAPSQFLQQYEMFRHAGESGGSLAAGSGTDRTDPDGATSDVGTGLFDGPGHSPQFYVKSTRTIADLMANGGPSTVGFWNAFGERNPEKGLILKVGKAAISWGGLGPLTRFDLVRGDLDLLRATSDFSVATQACVASNAPGSGVPYTLAPPAGTGWWFLARARRGSIVGTYDTLQPSQAGPRDPGIIASPFDCP